MAEGNNYNWWSNALKGDIGPIHEGQPQPGFYKKRFYDPEGPYVAPIKRPFIPCAIWFDTETQEYIGVADSKLVDACDLWLWCSKNPITEAEYRHYETLGEWPKEAE